jgi:ribosome maturation factor RimP
MIRREKIETLVSEVIKEGFFVVDIKISTGNKIMILVDAFEGANIKDCIEISRFIESNLDRDEEDFELEVSTPGLGKALKVPEQYKKNIGRNVTVQPREGKEITGELISFDEGNIELKEEKMVKPEGKKKKEKIEIVHKLNISDINSTKVVVSFK